MNLCLGETKKMFGNVLKRGVIGSRVLPRDQVKAQVLKKIDLIDKDLLFNLFIIVVCCLVGIWCGIISTFSPDIRLLSFLATLLGLIIALGVTTEACYL